MKGHADQLDYWQRHSEVPCLCTQKLLAKRDQHSHNFDSATWSFLLHCTTTAATPTKALKGDEHSSCLARTWIQCENPVNDFCLGTAVLEQKGLTTSLLDEVGTAKNGCLNGYTGCSQAEETVVMKSLFWY